MQEYSYFYIWEEVEACYSDLYSGLCALENFVESLFIKKPKSDSEKGLTLGDLKKRKNMVDDSFWNIFNNCNQKILLRHHSVHYWRFPISNKEEFKLPSNPKRGMTPKDCNSEDLIPVKDAVEDIIIYFEKEFEKVYNLILEKRLVEAYLTANHLFERKIEPYAKECSTGDSTATIENLPTGSMGTSIVTK